MSTLLYIKANIKPEGESRTFQISDHFIKEYQLAHPEDELITLDLYKENIDFLKPEDLQHVFGPKEESSKEHPILKYSYQFANADKYVFAAPMWNLGTPAILKAYFDYVSVTGITFKYTATGAEGLLKNKKALFITSRGGVYESGPTADMEMSERYLKTVLGFFGVTDFECIIAEGLDRSQTNVPDVIAATKKKASELVASF